MPNVAPRGLFARTGGAWKPPLDVWARVGGVWKEADYVWAFHNGAWSVIWGRLPTQPATAVATWVQTSTVRIDWTPPVINSNLQWIVRRADGSIVGIVPVGTLTITDTRPMLANGTTADSTVTYTVEGSTGTVSSTARTATPATFNLTAASLSATIAYPSATTANVTLNWTPNATYGQPQGWQAYLDGTGFVGPILAGTIMTTTVTGQGRGLSQGWRIVPFSQNPDGTWVQAGNYNPLTVNTAPGPPTNVRCYASGVSQLCGSFEGPISGRDVQDYHIQRWVDGNWIDWGYVGTGGPFCWSTTTAGYFRVASRSPALVESEWVQAGPATPVNDATGPGASYIQQWAPEASYGRMVVRGRWSGDGDTATGQIFCNVGGAGWTSVWGPAAVSPSGGIGVAVCTGSAGQQMGVLVRTWDVNGNMNTSDAVAYYNLVAATGVFNPTDGWTGRGGAWRGDSIGGQYACLQGNTSAGENTGYIFYGSQLTDYLVGRTYAGGWMEVWRQNDQGSGAAIAPGLVSHQWASVPATPPLINNQGSACLGPGLPRTGTVTGILSICTQIAQLIQSGWPGLAIWRGDYTSSDPNSAASLYMKMGNIGAANAGYIMGRVVLTSYG